MKLEEYPVRATHNYGEDSKSSRFCIIDRNQSLMMKVRYVMSQAQKIGYNPQGKMTVECGVVVSKFLSEIRGYREENGKAYLPGGNPLVINEQLPPNIITVDEIGLVSIEDFEEVLHHTGDCCEECKRTVEAIHTEPVSKEKEVIPA